MTRDWTMKALAMLAMLYVAFEVFANAHLLSAVGAAYIDQSAVEDMEKIMRSLSGVGAVVLIANLALPLLKSTRRRIKAFVIIASIVGPLTYLSVQLLVDGIVGRSEASDRQAGVMAYLYRMGMTNGSVPGALVLDDASPTNQKALLASIGLYVFPGSVLGRALLEHQMDYSKRIFKAELERPDMTQHLSKVLWSPFNAKYRAYLKHYEEQIATPSYDMVMADVRRQEERCVRYRARKDCGTPGFVTSDYVKAEVNKKIRKEAGFPVVEDYWLADRDSFRRAMIFSALKSAKSKGKARDIPYPMGRQEFAASQDADRWLSFVGFPYYFKGMPLSESLRAWGADKSRAIAGLEQNFRAVDLEGYQAEQIYRSMIIPPIALFLSLFFATLNLASLVSGVITKGRRAGFKLGVHAVILTGLALAPVLLSNSVSQSEWYMTITAGMPEASPLRYYVACWLMQVEPIIGWL